MNNKQNIVEPFKAKVKELRESLLNKTCVMCPEKVHSTRIDCIYCSKGCRQKAYRNRIALKQCYR